MKNKSILLIITATVSATLSMAQTYSVERLTPGQPLIDAQSFANAGLSHDEGRNINGPSVIKVPDWVPPEERADPSARYYMYFGNHGGKYIRMAWAEELTGPWTFYNMDPATPMTQRGVLGFEEVEAGGGDVVTYLGPNQELRIKNHMASPRVFVDDVNQRFVLFFHAPTGVNRGDGTFGNNFQRTVLALSGDGLDFRAGIQPVFIGADYLDPFSHDGRTHAFANQGYLHRAPAGATLENGGWWTPPEGHNLKDYLWPRITSPIREDHENDPDEVAKNPRHFSHRIVGDTAHIFFHRRDDEPESILLTKIDLSVGDAGQWDSTHPPEVILAPETDWEGINYPLEPSTGGGATGVVQLRDPFIYEEDGRIFMFYCGAGEEAIGLAELFPITGGAHVEF